MSLKIRFGLFALSIASLLWGFQEMLLKHAPHMFNAKEEDLTYAWYVPIFSLYVLWTERSRLMESIRNPEFLGVVLSLPFLVLGFIGVRGIQLRFEIVAFAGLLITSTWAFFGRKCAKQMLFPAGYLLFCIPLASFLDVVTVHLRLLSTSVAYGALKGFGADIIRVGTAISAADGSFSIDIAEPCSGLRSLFALMAITAAYAYFNQKTWLRRAFLFLLSVPIAIAGNVARILTICLVAAYADADFATGFYHDYSGYVVFAVAIVLMVAAGEGINRIPKVFCAKEKIESAKESASPSGLSKFFASITPYVTFVLVLVCMLFQSTTPEVKLCQPPEISFGELSGYKSESVSPSDAELQTLPKDTLFVKRRYFNDNGDWYLVSAVIGGASKSSIHRPELCLPAQGFLMTNPRTVSVGKVDWRFITLAAGGSPSMGFAYTFFNQAGVHTASHVQRILCDVWDRSIHNRIDRWVMVTVNSSRADDGALVEFLSRIGGMLP
jgi:exosortase